MERKFRTILSRYQNVTVVPPRYVAFVQRLIGESAKEQQLELDFMATRRTARREISVLTLGRRILDVCPHRLRELQPWRAVPPLAKQAASTLMVSA
ncbi:MAG: hypothetical protein GWO16_01690 [Gammaproteobacteria bacterium]|nr:hypothetical protein [Gammaproteobacteria bacterium]NIR96846.1 hypothetical protein [Gammaproteobacteria bacterium]NIT62557.1 hypothetical protein [Gammaproteobacteria bacterium]NIV19501.1 hypothetical protein [Gammaproteobacteria bacterium]NIY31137.1 hypothetical protein [Gammaproteobacteria bacterium]